MNDRPRRKSASYRTITTNREKKAMEEEEQADEKRSGKAKSETRMLIEEEKDKTTAGNAYIIVIPDPTPEDARGIRRVDSKGLPGKYYFWIKIGDSRNAENRVTDYCDSDSKHVVMHVTGKLHPGKQLELECLKDHAKGGLLQGSQTEWHQLCAQDRDHAGRIRGQLMTLLNGVDNKTLTYSKALIRIQNALANTTDPLFNSEPAADAVVNKWITLLIYPRIDLGRINCGVERYDKQGNISHYEFRVLVESTETRWSTVDTMIAAKYVNMCPDVSYNALQIPRKWDRAQTKQAVKDVKMYITTRFGGISVVKSSVDPESGWFSIWISPWSFSRRAGNVVELGPNRFHKFHRFVLGFHRLSMVLGSPKQPKKSEESMGQSLENQQDNVAEEQPLKLKPRLKRSHSLR